MPAVTSAGIFFVGGDEGARTPGLGIANAALSQLSYIPVGQGCFSTRI